MAFPTLTKSWGFREVEVARNATHTIQSQNLLYEIKQTLKLFSPAWTVWGSSNGLTAFGNGDAVDRWASYTTNLVWANVGTNHSWMVLRQTGLGAWILLDCTPGTAPATALTVKYSKLGFGLVNGGTNGNANTAPTATDQVTINAVRWGAQATANIRQYIHALQSTDGQCTRIFITSKAQCFALWMFDTAIATDAGWTDPKLFSVQGYGADIANLNSYGRPWTKIGATNLQLNQASLCRGTTVASNIQSERMPLYGVAGWPLYEIPLYCTDKGIAGYKGRMVDMWWGSTARYHGDCYPNDGVRSLVQFGNLVVPWNGTEPTIGSSQW